jgi:hypothetical protein
MADEYTKSIADAGARRDAQMALRAARERRQAACVQFFKNLEICLGTEIETANPALEKGSFAERFDGPHVSTPPEYRMTLSLGGSSHKREVVLDLSDQTRPTVRVLEPENGGVVALQYLLEDKGSGLRAFNTEGSGVADWRTDYTPTAVAKGIVVNVIDGLFK